MLIKCKQCGLPVTNELKKFEDPGTLNENDNEDFIPQGYYFVSDGGFFTGSERKIIINKSDLINSKNHMDSKRLAGCCGLDGLDGFNKTCRNEHEIATEHSDCWKPHCVIFEPDLIRVEEYA